MSGFKDEFPHCEEGELEVTMTKKIVEVPIKQFVEDIKLGTTEAGIAAIRDIIHLAREEIKAESIDAMKLVTEAAEAKCKRYERDNT